MPGFLLGFDIGSSSVKCSLLAVDTGRTVASASSPETEMTIDAHKPGWAEQPPELWWEHARNCVAAIAKEHRRQLDDVAAIGISYQMHGLVMLDQSGKVVRPSIIWCDSRAVPYGNRAFDEIGEKKCLSHMLNSPGNFTASKLAWVKEHEPENFRRTWKIMLPGDYIAYRLTGEAITTPSGLSEGILWDAMEEGPARMVLDYFGYSRDVLAEYRPTFSEQGRVTTAAAREIGLKAGIPVAYRAGDQPNNALSLNVLKPGELAATAGTSGVVYAVVDHPAYDERSRVNTFVHVNHAPEEKRYGILLCLNGTGSLNRWMKQTTIDPVDFESYERAKSAPVGSTGAGAGSKSQESGRRRVLSRPDSRLGYGQINEIAALSPIGSRGLCVLPFGNGAERILENVDPGASIHGLNVNIHDRSDLLRAAQEGIVFALNYGLDIIRGMGIELTEVKAGHANMFLSPLFASAFSTVTGMHLRLHRTDGAEGAARGAGIGARVFASPSEAFIGLEEIRVVEPEKKQADAYADAYGRWLEILSREIPDAQ